MTDCRDIIDEETSLIPETDTAGNGNVFVRALDFFRSQFASAVRDQNEAIAELVGLDSMQCKY